MSRAETTGRVGHGDPPPQSRQIQAAGPKKDEPKIKGIVARGRSIQVPKIGEDGQIIRRVVGFHPVTEQEITAAVLEYIEEFCEIELPESEVMQLRKSGYLIDPANVNSPVRGEGPSFTEMRPGSVQPQQTAYAR